jgi:2-hydroxy-6-oxonona-2,4-dienedioate hydrolase
MGNLATRADFKSGFAPADGAKIYFESAGVGPAVVFIHAGVSDRRMWDPQFDYFADRFHVVRYDLRGFGKSEMPDLPYSNRADLGKVLQFLGIEKAALVGCSMGGSAAIDFTLENPERVLALVTVGSGVSGWNEWSDEGIRHWTEFMRLAKAGEIERARELEAVLWLDGPGRELSRIDPTYRRRAREIHKDNFSLAREAHPEEELSPPAIRRLGEIKCPTLVLVGDSDMPEILKVASYLAKEIPGARLATVANAAHLPNLEHPDEFNAIVKEFLTAML